MSEFCRYLDRSQMPVFEPTTLQSQTGFYHPIYDEMLVLFLQTFFEANSQRPNKEQTMADMSEGCKRMSICPVVHAERRSCSMFFKGTDVNPGETFTGMSDGGTRESSASSKCTAAIGSDSAGQKDQNDSC